MQTLRSNHPPPEVTAFDIGDPGFFFNLFHALSDTSLHLLEGDDKYVSLTEVFLGGPSSRGVELWTLPLDQYESRLIQVFNTFWLPSLAIPTGFGNDLGKFGVQCDLGSDVNGTNQPHCTPTGPFVGVNATGQLTTLYDIFVCHFQWASVLLASASILSTTALIGLVLKYLTLSPDILSYMSTLTRDNPYIALPPGGTALDGDEKARLLRGVRVQLGDVAWNNSVGHIALASVNRPEGVARLKKRRLYN
jgi:hypothetical protein